MVIAQSESAMRNPTGSRLPTGLIAVLLATSSTTLFASGVDQRAPRDLVEQVVFDARHNTASSVKARIRPRSGDTPLQTSIEFVARHRELFRLRDPSTELRLYKTETDNLGYTHLRLNQQYRNIPVWGCQKIAHFDAAGELYMVAGQSIPTPHLDTTPRITADAARESGTAEVGALLNRIDVVGRSELYVYPAEDGAHLAWRVTVTVPGSHAIRWRVFIDAHTGQTLLKISDIPMDGPASGWGIDVLGNLQPLKTYQQGGTFRMIDASQPMFDAPVDSLRGVIVTYDNWRGGGPITTDPDGDNVFDDDPSQRPAVSGHYYAQLTYEYFLNTFGRDSFDDSGATIRVGVHDSMYVNNAYWGLDSSINFSDGDGINYLPFSGALDVVAHELAHGVSVHGPGLIYGFASGALHEHYSDFIGAMLDREDWQIGEDIVLTPPFIIRDLADPPATGLPDHYSDYVYVSAYNDAGGVHTNCGIGNKAGYLVGTLLDRERAEQIWYRAWTTYLTPTADYPFFALATLQAASDLYGDPSVELSAVSEAMDSVGLAGVFAAPPTVHTRAITLGEQIDTLLTVFNLGSTPVQIDSVSTSHPLLSVSSSLPVTLGLLDTAVFTATFDASALGSACDVGEYSGTVTFYTGSAAYPVVPIPITVPVTFVDAPADTITWSSSCLDLSTHNTPGFDHFVLDSIDALFDASLILGMVDGTDTLAFWDLNESPNFIPVDTFVSVSAPPSFEARSLRWVTPDRRLHGRVTFTWSPSVGGQCDYFLIDYTIHNDCDTTQTFLAALFTDFNVTTWTLNRGEVVSGRELVMIRDDLDTRACGITLLQGESRNLRLINNPLIVWDGFTAAEAYIEMASVEDTVGNVADDWSALLTFGQPTLAAGDSVHYQVAIIYSNQGTAGVTAVADALGAGSCPVSMTGDVNEDGTLTSADIISLVNYVFKAGPAPGPIEAAGDANCDGSVASSDIIRMVNYIFKGDVPPCDICSIL